MLLECIQCSLEATTINFVGMRAYLICIIAGEPPLPWFLQRTLMLVRSYNPASNFADTTLVLDMHTGKF